MKKLHSIVIALLISFSAYCQSPSTFKYQAVIRDAQGNVMSNKDVALTVKIIDKVEFTKYSEIHNVTTNQFGLVNLEVGSDNPNAFSEINWSQGGFKIEVELNGVEIGRSNILTVPYAIHAKTADRLSGTLPETDPIYSSSQAANITANDITKLNNLSGTNTGDQDLSDYATTTALNNKVDKVAGKDLSTNDYTDAEKAIVAKQSGTNTGDQNLSSYATKAYVALLEEKILRYESIDSIKNGITDSRDGNHYDIVQIGTQIWMAENLKYLPSVVSSTTNSDDVPYYYVNGYNGTSVSAAKSTVNYAAYGVLYNWTAAMNSQPSSPTNPSNVQGICPTGWHLPSNAEWQQLIDYLGANPAKDLREAEYEHWRNDGGAYPGTNETGFTALPGGDIYSPPGENAYWWTATEPSGGGDAYYREIQFDSYSVYDDYVSYEEAYSVRCVRD